MNPAEPESLPPSAEPESGETEKKKKETNPKDPVFKAVIKDYFESPQLAGLFKVTLGKQVGQLQLEIDTSIDAISDEDLTGKLADTSFWFFRRHNFVEYKSVNDDLDEENFALILGRAFMGYSTQPEAERDEVISCIITDAYPGKIFKRLRKRGSPFRAVKGHPGLYYHKGINFPIYVVVCNRLPLEPLYYSLLMFASGKKLEAYFSQFAVDTGMQIFLKYVVRMYPKQGGKIAEEVERKMTETEVIDLATALIEGNKYFTEGFLEALSRKEGFKEDFLEALSRKEGFKEDFLEALSRKEGFKEDFLEALPGDEVVKQGMKKLDADEIASIIAEEQELTPEERELLKKLLSKRSKN